MKNKNYKIFIVTLSILFVYFFTANFVSADLKIDLENRLTNVGKKAEYITDTFVFADVNLATYIGTAISYILSMLGVIFLVLLIYGGFLWMTAKGDSEVVSKSKDIIINAMIGLIIVLMSYAITYYVVGKIAGTTMGAKGGFIE
jgi:hypothetical protein